MKMVKKLVIIAKMDLVFNMIVKINVKLARVILLIVIIMVILMVVLLVMLKHSHIQIIKYNVHNVSHKMYNHVILIHYRI